MTIPVETAAVLQHLIKADDSGGLGALLSNGTLSIDRPLMESLKKQIDFEMRSDANRALKLAELAGRLADRVDDPIIHALSLRGKAQALHVLGRYEEAVLHYRKAAEFYESADCRMDVARVRRAMMDALMYLGRYEEALAVADLARKTFEAAGDPLALAQLNTNVGNVYHRLDQLQPALDCYSQARKTFQSQGESLGEAITSFNEANILSSLNDFRRSEELYGVAEALYQSRGMELAATQTRYSIAYLHFLRGNYHRSVRELHDIRKTFERLGDTRASALCDLDLSEIYLQMNVFSEAEELALRARAAFAGLGMRYEGAKALMFLGLSRMNQRRLDESESDFRVAVLEFGEEGNEVQAGLVTIYQAELALNQYRPGDALRLAEQAQAVFTRNLLPTRRRYAALIAVRALLAGGEKPRALRDCLSLKAELPADELPWLESQVCELLGDLLMQTSNSTGSMLEYRRSIECVERIRSLIRVDEFRSAFFADKVRVYEKMIHLCLDARTREGVEHAFFYLESRKARTLADLLADDPDFQDPAAVPTELMQNWTRVREELHWFYGRIADNDSKDKSRSTTVDLTLRERILDRERRLVELTRELQIQDIHFEWQDSRAGVSLDELQSFLQADETLLEYYVNDATVMVFIVDRESIRLAECGAMPAVRDALAGLEFQMGKFQFGRDYVKRHEDNLVRSANVCLSRLYDALIRPVAESIAGRRLIIVPFEALHSVPFHALFDGSHYVIDDHEVSYAPSARMHLACGRRPPASGNGMTLLGVSDAFAPHIDDEIKAIGDVFPEAVSLVGPMATMAAMRERAPLSNVVHIASHGVFRHDNPMFSAIRLADCWLTAFEACSLKLPSAFVTLSGCSTAVGRLGSGDEMQGLVRGFLRAGAASLLASLWTADDPATATLMTIFYRGLSSGCGARPALRQAILSTKKQLPHPYYWGAFVLIGRS